jgi:hypothetical protein
MLSLKMPPLAHNHASALLSVLMALSMMAPLLLIGAHQADLLGDIVRTREHFYQQVCIADVLLQETLEWLSKGYAKKKRIIVRNEPPQTGIYRDYSKKVSSLLNAMHGRKTSHNVQAFVKIEKSLLPTYPDDFFVTVYVKRGPSTVVTKCLVTCTKMKDAGRRRNIQQKKNKVSCVVHHYTLSVLNK